MRFLAVCLLALACITVLFGSSLAYPDCPDCGICQQRYHPVCGEDGVTYHNACHLGCEKTCRKPGLKIVHDGECGSQLLAYHH